MANWIQDPQGRYEIDKVTEEIKLPILKPSAKGKFREWLTESFTKIEDYLMNLKQSLQENINSKEPSFSKKSGFNLEKTNVTENDSNKLFTAKGALDLFNKLTSLIAEKEPKISKMSGFNLSKSDADDLDSSNTLATSKAVKKVKDALNRLNLSWENITNKPSMSDSIDLDSSTTIATSKAVHDSSKDLKMIRSEERRVGKECRSRW